jgi:hypothetical protein
MFSRIPGDRQNPKKKKKQEIPRLKDAKSSEGSKQMRSSSASDFNDETILSCFDIEETPGYETVDTR